MCGPYVALLVNVTTGGLDQSATVTDGCKVDHYKYNLHSALPSGRDAWGYETDTD
jgi:hypothetical protein